MAKLMGSILAVILLGPLTAMAGPVMYVPTGDANEVVIIDLNTDTIVGRIDELENAHGLAASPNSEFLIAGSMQVVRTDEITSLQAAKPGGMSEEEHKAHHASDTVGTGQQSYISIIHPVHGHVMRRITVQGLTHHTAVSPDGNIAIAVHSQNGGISVIDLKSNSVIHVIKTGEAPNYAIFSSDGRYLYVSNAGNSAISEIDTRNWSIVRAISTGKGPEHMEFSANGRNLYVANVFDGTASEIDIKTGKITKSYTVGKSPHGIALSGDGKELFVSAKDDNQLKRFDINTGAEKSMELVPEPYHVTYLEKPAKLYVSSRGAPKIWVIDPEKWLILSEINFDSGVAHQMVIVEGRSGD